MRHSRAYAVPINWVDDSPFHATSRPSFLRRSARPLVVVLRDGSIIFRGADGSFFTQGRFTHSLGGSILRSDHCMSFQVATRDRRVKGLLDVLSRETSVLPKFYAGESIDYAGLTSEDI